MNTLSALLFALFISFWIQASMAILSNATNRSSQSVTGVTQTVNITPPLSSVAITSPSTNLSSVVVSSSADLTTTIVASSTIAPNASSTITVKQNNSGSASASKMLISTSTIVIATRNYSSSVATPSYNISSSHAASSIHSTFTISASATRNYSSSVATPSGNISSSRAASSIVVPQSVNSAVFQAVNSTHIAGTASFNMMLNSTVGLQASMLHSTFTISASGQASNTVIMRSSKISQSVKLQASTLSHSSSLAVVSAMTQGSLTVSVSNSSFAINATPASSMMLNSTVGLQPSMNASTASLYLSANSTTVPVNASVSPQVTQKVSSSAFSFTSPNVTKNSSSSAVVSVTSSLLHSTFTISASGQTSEMVITPSSKISQSIQLQASSFSQSSSLAIVSVITQGSPTVTVSNSSSTINAMPASSKTTPRSSTPVLLPTSPPGEKKYIEMEVSFDIEFKDEYNDPESEEYKKLEKNLTTTLWNVYKGVEGFVAVRIVLITKGSVVCNYIVILAQDSKVAESDLKEKLESAKEDLGKLGFSVLYVKVDEGERETKTEEKLPKWALAVMIVMGCLTAVCVVAMFYVCVKYRRTLYGSSDAYLVSRGEIGVVHTYDSVDIGGNKTGTTQKSTAERRIIGSHTNPTYNSNGALGE